MRYPLRFLAVLLALGLVYFGFRILKGSGNPIAGAAPQQTLAEKALAPASPVTKSATPASRTVPAQPLLTQQASGGKITRSQITYLAPQKRQAVAPANTPRASRTAPTAATSTRAANPSPIDTLSPAEAKQFPGAVVVAAVAVPGPGPDQTTQVRILKTDSPTPMVRTEEVISGTTPEVVAREEMAADQVLVTLAEGITPDSLLASLPGQLVSFKQVSPGTSLYTFQLASSGVTSLPEALDALSGLQGGSVRIAEPNFIYTSSLTPDDPYYLDGSLWGLHNIGQFGGTADADIDAPEGWDVRSLVLPGTVVAVIDSGVRYTHVDLVANMWTNPTEIPANGIDDDNNGYIDDVHGINAIDDSGDPMDHNGHGTHCAGTIGGVGNNGVGVTGVAWNVQIMACKFLDGIPGGTTSGSTADAIKCIDYARLKGAKIMSNSWGGPSYSDTLLEAITRAQSAGIIFVAAAGNDSSNNDLIPNYPSNYTLGNIIAVASSTRNDVLSDFSNYGATSVDLAAPGSEIWSTYIGTKESNLNANNLYAELSGTSMATPLVAGASALLISQFPNENYVSIKDRLLTGTNKLTALAGTCVSGGRLNLYNSLLDITPRPTPTPRPAPTPLPTPAPRATPPRTTPPRTAPTVTPTPTPMPSVTPLPTPGPTAQPTPAATPTPTATATPYPSVTPSGTPTPMPTPAPTAAPRTTPPRTTAPR